MPVIRSPFRGLRKVTPAKVNMPCDIVFDLETSGLDPNSKEILQLAAMTKDQQNQFNVYIMPSRPLEQIITDITGIDVTDVEGKPCMFVDGRNVQTVTLEEAMLQFVAFLKEHSGKGKVNLIGHNGVKFDYRFLYKALTETNVFPKFKSTVCSFTDTLPAFQNAMPWRRSHKQVDLVNDLLPDYQYKPHCALEDVKGLASLLPKLHITHFMQYTYTFNSVTSAVKASLSMS